MGPEQKGGGSSWTVGRGMKERRKNEKVGMQGKG